MGIFRKQTTRAPLTTVLLVLLLALSIAASSIGFTAWTGAKKQFAEIDSHYTTIAIPSGENQEKLFKSGTQYSIGYGSKQFSDGTKYIDPLDAEITASTSDYYQYADHRILLSAHVADGIPLTSGTLDPLDYSATLNTYCYELCVMALRCISLETNVIYDDGTTSDTYNVGFEILDDVCRIDAYDLPPYEDVIYTESRLYARDGSVPFEVGKTYLVRGRYWDYDIKNSYDMTVDEDGKEVVTTVRVRDLGADFTPRVLLIDSEHHTGLNIGETTGVTNGLPNWTLERRQYPDSDQYYWCTPEKDCWPYYAEYEGSWKDFLETEEGQVWKDEIIPNFEMNHSSVPVILTDNLQSMYVFNSGDVSILEGSLFTDEDYQNGNDVCLVSAAYAQVNGLSVGDTINLDYYNVEYEARSYTIGAIGGRRGMTIVRSPLTWNTRIDVQKNYTIVGIYTGPNWPGTNHGIQADTILVPKASVPDASKYTGPSLPLLYTVIIENGSIDAFEAHMAANDKAGAYLYFDQGYTEAAATVQTMIDNAMRLMLVGIAMFVLASLLFLLLYARRTSSVMRSMRLLGVPKKQTWLECLGTLFSQEIIAVMLGNTLAVILYDRITVQLLSSTPALSIESVLLCGGVQLGALLLIGGIWMNGIAGRNLMQRREGGILWKRNKAASCGA